MLDLQMFVGATTNRSLERRKLTALNTCRRRLAVFDKIWVMLLIFADGKEINIQTSLTALP